MRAAHSLSWQRAATAASHSRRKKCAHILKARTRLVLTGAAVVAAIGLLAGCTGSGADENVVDQGTNSTENAAAGDKVVIGFSGPAADHGWLGAINSGAQAAADSFSDVDLKVAEGTNDPIAQIAAVETFVNDGVDAIVLLPTDGAALTEAAIAAMNAGIPVINVDREFSSPFAARATILGDNYGMGVSAGTYICGKLGDKPDAIVAEIAGIDSLPLTQDRSKGFKDALSDCGLEGQCSGRCRLHRRRRRGGGIPAARGQPAHRRDLEPRRRPGHRRPRGDRIRRPQRVLHDGRRGKQERDGGHQG